MKKILALFTAMVFTLALIGCDADDFASPGAQSQNSTVNSSQNSSPENNNSSAADSTSSVYTRDKVPDNVIGKEQAQKLVFERAGVNADDVTELETEIDFDDDWHGWEYDIEFNVGAVEYEAEVNAVTGEIISFYKDK